MTDDTASLVFVDNPGFWDRGSSSCEGSSFSNLKCPFSSKRSIDFTAGFVEEQRCRCFPEITRERIAIDAWKKTSFINMGKAIPTLGDSSTCASDMSFTSMIVSKPGSEDNFFFSPMNVKGCGGRGSYVEGAAAQRLSDAIAEELQGVPSIRERALRKIFADHRGFFLSYALSDPKDFPLCNVQSSFLYKAAAQQVDVALCDRDRGMRFQTLKLDAAENERLLNALKALEAPTMESRVKSCSVREARHFELYQADGTPDVYSLDDPSCERDGLSRDDFRRHIFAPSAEDFLNIVSIYDNF